jgi:heme-degrading monooxygenase HmoA
MGFGKSGLKRKACKYPTGPYYLKLTFLIIEHMIIQIIKLKSNLEESELMKRAREREPQFREIPGLLQKYYVKMDTPGQYGGIYVWDSKESLLKYRASDLAASIPEAYEVIEAPEAEVLDVLFQLRN